MSRIVEDNGGLRNTIAMGSFDKGYSSCSLEEQQIINQQISEMGVCPQCGDKPTYQTPDGTFWDGNAHYWRKA